jgi:hypothetical protein
MTNCNLGRGVTLAACPGRTFPTWKRRGRTCNIILLSLQLQGHAASSAIEILQRPGVTVYVPAAWPHSVLNTKCSVTITHTIKLPTFDGPIVVVGCASGARAGYTISVSELMVVFSTIYVNGELPKKVEWSYQREQIRKVPILRSYSM